MVIKKGIYNINIIKLIKFLIINIIKLNNNINIKKI